MLATDGDVRPSDRVPVGYDDTLPITYRDLLAMLDRADPDAAASPRRTVQAKTSATGGEDGLVIIDLAPGQDGTEVVVLAIEGTSIDPDDPFWGEYRFPAHPGADTAAGRQDPRLRGGCPGPRRAPVRRPAA